jgi:hypothetical protein
MFKQIHMYFGLYDLVHTHMFKQIHVDFGLYDLVHIHVFKQIHAYFGLSDLVHTHTCLKRFMYILDCLSIIYIYIYIKRFAK